MDLPHVLDYVIEIRRGDTTVASERCDVFHTNHARTSGRWHRYDSAGRSYDGLLRGCSIRMPAGRYTVRAHDEWVGGRPDPRFVFERTDLILRLP
jgi:hypothetical protein